MLINAGGVTIQTHWIVLSEFKKGVLTIRYLTNGNDTQEFTISGVEAEAIHKGLVEEAERDAAISKANTENLELTLSEKRLSKSFLDGFRTKVSQD